MEISFDRLPVNIVWSRLAPALLQPLTKVPELQVLQSQAGCIVSGKKHLIKEYVHDLVLLKCTREPVLYL